MSNGIYGDTTRELWETWTQSVGTVDQRASGPEVLHKLFNEIDLYPSQSQIFEMVQCARECSNHVHNMSFRSSTVSSDRSSRGSNQSEKALPLPAAKLQLCEKTEDSNLTFGEFCVFATELRKYYLSHEKKQRGGHHHHHNRHDHYLRSNRTHQSGQSGSKSSSSCSNSGSREMKKRTELRTQKSSASAYDVFLGGSCNPTTWRQDTAIPYLKSHGITYYNPQQSNWVPEMIELEHQAKQTSQILFFVINETNRNVVSMIEVSYFAGAQRKMIVVINPYVGPGDKVGGEPMTEMEYTDLSQALTTVHDLVERQGLPVFNDIKVALNCTAKVVKEDVAIEDLGSQDNARPVKLAHLQIGDKLVRLREAFDTLDTNHVGEISLADLRMAFRIHAHRDLTTKDLTQILMAHGWKINKKSSPLPLDKTMIDFDHFCCIVSEFKHLNLPRESSRSRERGKATRRIFYSITHPFHKLSHCMVTPFSKSHRDRTGSHSLIPTNMKRRGSQLRDVYLGGTMRGSRWREKEAIPMLKKNGLTFFNPLASASSSSPTSSSSSSSAACARVRRLIPIETAAMDNSRVLLFVILATARSVGAMNEAAYYIGKGATVVLCIQKIPENVSIDNGEQLSKSALKDYNRGRCYLSDIANREGVPVFEEIHEAVECILQKCKSFK